MDFLRAFDLNLWTLLGVFSLPFIYFIVHHRFWYDGRRIQRSDNGLMVLSVVILLALMVKFVPEARGASRQDWQVIILHALAPILTMLIIRNPRVVTVQVPSGSSSSPGVGSSGTRPIIADQSFKPLVMERPVSWDELIVDDHLKFELQSVIELLRDPRTVKKYGISVPKGILLSGPPGTGKTTLAKVIASNAGLAFFIVKADEVVSKWVGESEKNLAKVFDAAARHAPAVIFLDEIDSIGRARSGEQAWADNLVNQLLQLIDGVLSREGIYIIGATNRPDLVDPALKRAGRLTKVIEIPLPSHEQRKQLFRLYLSKLPLGDQLDLDILAKLTDGKSGATIKEICNQAGVNAFKRETVSGGNREYQVRHFDIEQALHEFMA